MRIATDHGWLLLPEGLPKVELPADLAETKWSRCAVVKGDPSVPSYSWQWNPHIRIASPPGIGCFRAGEKYSHGGVSLQECVVPEVIVEQGIEAMRASIVSIEWRGMRCRVKVDTNDPRVRVDVRTNWKQNLLNIDRVRLLRDALAKLNPLHRLPRLLLRKQQGWSLPAQNRQTHQDSRVLRIETRTAPSGHPPSARSRARDCAPSQHPDAQGAALGVKGVHAVPDAEKRLVHQVFSDAGVAHYAENLRNM